MSMDLDKIDWMISQTIDELLCVISKQQAKIPSRYGRFPTSEQVGKLLVLAFSKSSHGTGRHKRAHKFPFNILTQILGILA